MRPRHLAIGFLILIGSLILLSLTSCDPGKRIQRICKNNPEACKLKPDSVAYRDTVITKTVEVSLPGETVLFDSPCDTVYTHDTVIVKKQGHLSAIVEHKGGKVTFKCKEDSLIKANVDLKIQLDSAMATIIKNAGVEVVKNAECEHEATTFDIICYSLFGIFCLYVIYQIFRIVLQLMGY